MYRSVASTVMAMMFISHLPGAAPDPALGPQAEKRSSPKKSPAASMTGCVDEQGGQYLLLDDRTRDPIANLEADGFETEGFAKHVGHKVTVRGTSSPNGSRPIFRVRSIETISETCGQQSVH